MLDELDHFVSFLIEQIYPIRSLEWVDYAHAVNAMPLCQMSSNFDATRILWIFVAHRNSKFEGLCQSVIALTDFQTFNR